MFVFRVAIWVLAVLDQGENVKWCNSSLEWSEILALVQDVMLHSGKSLYTFQTNFANFWILKWYHVS